MTTQQYNATCAVGIILKILGGKWKILIIHNLLTGTKRFNELRRIIPDITQRMLTNQLRELEADKIIIRKIAFQPPKIYIYQKRNLVSFTLL